MNKHTTLPNLMQKIVSDEDIQTITEAVGYHDSSRKFTVRTLIDFSLSLLSMSGRVFVMVLMWRPLTNCRVFIIRRWQTRRRRFHMKS